MSQGRAQEFAWLATGGWPPTRLGTVSDSRLPPPPFQLAANTHHARHARPCAASPGPAHAARQAWPGVARAVTVTLPSRIARHPHFTSTGNDGRRHQRQQPPAGSSALLMPRAERRRGPRPLRQHGGVAVAPPARRARRHGRNAARCWRIGFTSSCTIASFLQVRLDRARTDGTGAVDQDQSRRRCQINADVHAEAQSQMAGAEHPDRAGRDRGLRRLWGDRAQSTVVYARCAHSTERQASRARAGEYRSVSSIFPGCYSSRNGGRPAAQTSISRDH